MNKPYLIAEMGVNFYDSYVYDCKSPCIKAWGGDASVLYC